MAAAKNPVHGDKHHNAKLTADDVRLIRELVEERARLLAEARKLSERAIAEKFGISRGTVWKVANREAWIRQFSIKNNQKTTAERGRMGA